MKDLVKSFINKIMVFISVSFCCWLLSRGVMLLLIHIIGDSIDLLYIEIYADMFVLFGLIGLCTYKICANIKKLHDDILDMNKKSL